MPLDLPKLDDRSYEDLVQEGIALIQRYAPRWTNHNATDPGITLIELLAYFTEMLIYRLDQVSRDTKVQFLHLLRGADWVSEDHLADATVDQVEGRIARAVSELRTPHRAVTAGDFEDLAIRASVHGGVPGAVVRARAIVGRNLEIDPAYWDDHMPGHVSVVILPGQVADVDFAPTKLVKEYLEPRCLLTTRLHVVEPSYQHLLLGLAVDSQVAVSSHGFEPFGEGLAAKLEQHFSPYPGGGRTGEGWPFGHAVDLREALEALLRVPEGMAVRDLNVLQISSSEQLLHDPRSAIGMQIGIRSTVGVDSYLGMRSPREVDRLVRGKNGELSAIALRPYELVKVEIEVATGPMPFAHLDKE